MWIVWIVIDACLAALVLLARCFLWLPMLVKGSSMMSTLHNGQLVWATRIGLRRRGVSRGDVVICHYPGRTWRGIKWLRPYYVKRVIGLPGESISMVDGVTHINGEPLPEPYLDLSFCMHKRQMPERQIGPDEVFVMGDHRDNSHDSRRIGPIGRDQLVARVTRILWPYKDRRQL